MFSKSFGGTRCATETSCRVMTGKVFFESLSSSVSPTQSTTLSPFSKLFSTFRAMNSSDSLTSGRFLLSECPKITHFAPTSSSMFAVCSPVYAPSSESQTFCPATSKSFLRAMLTLSMYGTGGAQTTSTESESDLPLFSPLTSSSTADLSPLHFQFPPIQNLRVISSSATPSAVLRTSTASRFKPSLPCEKCARRCESVALGRTAVALCSRGRCCSCVRCPARAVGCW
mmetsp:Transcript_30535/g.74365  ORF Transcript_30535/g.74365 Transcript_30535/m.74365 type:complete len:228 (+) Transcript_30535:1586-2269(+)